MQLELITAGSLIVSLTFYVLMGGADYGGGVWDLFASGERAAQQRELIAEVMGPIWEANHVWLILVIVVLFTAFPPAFATISTLLHIPLTLMLIGIVLRGSAFSFRTYDVKDDQVQRRWGRVFAISSLFTPVMLGIVVGAISSETMQLQNPDFIRPWCAPFPIAVGCFALAIFAFLAATYLTGETVHLQLQDDFRQRALLSQLAVAAMALVVFLLAREGAPGLWQHLAGSAWTWPLQIITAVVSVSAIVTLWQRRYKLARLFAGGQATLILWGWAFAQFPYLVRPDLTLFNCAAEPEPLRLLLYALIAGALLLFPSLYYLLAVFHRLEKLTSRS